LNLLENVYPSADLAVLGDAGNGVITQEFLQNDLAKWGIERNLPDWMPGLNVPLTQLEASDLYIEAGKTYPNARFATYTAAYDGGTGGQTGFYNIMLNPVASDPSNVLLWLQWHNASCAWNREMTRLNDMIASEVPNFRFYVRTGSAHTMWGRDDVYSDTTGGTPTLANWIRAMLAGNGAWVNVEAQDFGVLLEGDPRPNPLAPPFFQDGAGARIVCE
jgi:hypothetical protein